MGELSSGIFVGCLEKRVYARVVGRGTFQNSQPLRRFALGKIDQGHEEFVFNLGLCQGMDSTFLGVLVGIGLHLKQKGPSASIRIVNINQRNLDMLRTLGLDRLFRIDGDASASTVDADYQLFPDTDITQLKRRVDKDGAAVVMMEAHENLARVDQRNTPKFKELARILRETNRPSTPPVRVR